MLVPLPAAPRSRRLIAWMPLALALAGVLHCGLPTPLRCVLVAVLAVLAWRNQRRSCSPPGLLIVNPFPFPAPTDQVVRHSCQPDPVHRLVRAPCGHRFASAQGGRAGAWGLTLRATAASRPAESLDLRAKDSQPEVLRRLARWLLHRRRPMGRSRPAPRGHPAFRYNPSLPRIQHPTCPLP